MAAPVASETTAILSGILFLLLRELYKFIQDKKLVRQQTGYFTDIKDSIDNLHEITKELSGKATENATNIKVIMTRMQLYETSSQDCQRRQDELNRGFEAHIDCLHEKLFSIVKDSLIATKEKIEKK